MKKLMLVSSSPHFRADTSVRKIMMTVILSFLPVLIFSVIAYGLRALVVTVLSVVTCIVSEFVFDRVRRHEQTVSDFSCVVNGMLFAFCLPVDIPYLMVVCGAVFGTVIVKMMFGGLGKYWISPAMTSKIFLCTWLAFPTVSVQAFSAEKVPVLYDSLFGWGTEVDVPATVTLLDTLKAEAPFDGTAWDLLLGTKGGNLGEICTVLLLVAGLYCVVCDAMSRSVPFLYLAGVAAASLLIPYGGQFFSADHVLLQLCGGGTVLIAFFVATDFSTCPVTTGGRILFGLLCGVLTVVLRRIGCPGDGAVYAVLFAELFTDLIDRIARPRPYGKGGHNA